MIFGSAGTYPQPPTCAVIPLPPITNDICAPTRANLYTVPVKANWLLVVTRSDPPSHTVNAGGPRSMLASALVTSGCVPFVALHPVLSQYCAVVNDPVSERTASPTPAPRSKTSTPLRLPVPLCSVLLNAKLR